MSTIPSFDVRSIKLYARDSNVSTDTDERDYITNISLEPKISVVRRKEDKFYQQHLPVDDGIYDGTVSENLSREGLGTFSSNNGERYYSGLWQNDKPCGNGYRFDKGGAVIYYGKFNDNVLEEGYGKIQFDNGYSYDGKMKDGKFHGLGSLCVEIKGLKELDASEVNKQNLKLVAEWENGRTKFVYRNEIKEYYKHCYEVFSGNIESINSLKDENQQTQREYFQNLIDLLSESHSNIDLLKEIASPSRNFPAALKSSADLLAKLDLSFSNLRQFTNIDEKESYKECLQRLCKNGLKLYAARLASSDHNDRSGGISARIIFDQSLNSFIARESISDLKDVLLINPLVVDLIHHIIRYANEKLAHVPRQYQSLFIKTHTALILSIWKDYFNDFKNNPQSNLSNTAVKNRYHFYADCYSNLLDLSVLSEFRVEISIEKSRMSSLKIKIKENTIFNGTAADSNQSFILIVLHGVSGVKKLDQRFQPNADCSAFREQINSLRIDDSDIIIVSLLDYPMDNLYAEYKAILKQLGCTKIENAVGNVSWVFIGKKTPHGKIDEGIVSDSQRQLLIRHNIRCEIRMKSAAEKHNIKDTIESIILKSTMFSLKNLKPWREIPVDVLSSFLSRPIHREDPIQEIASRFLIRILKNIENVIKNYFEANIFSSTDVLLSVISHYQYCLLRDESLNYQSKMKGIIKVADYLLQISLIENSSIKNMIDLQLRTIKTFIQANETITEVIEQFLNLNEEFLKVIEIFNNRFSADKHEIFHRRASDIVSSVQDVLCFILENWKNVINQSDILKRYAVSDLKAAFEIAIFSRNIHDVEILLGLGVDVNMELVSSGETPIHYAVMEKDTDLILLLLEKGANTQVKNRENLSVLDYAKDYNQNLITLKKEMENRKKGISKQVDIQLYALQKVNSFLTNLRSSDFTWIIEDTRKLDSNLFEKVPDKDLYRVLDISKAKVIVNETCKHYVLETIAELLDLLGRVPNFHRSSPVEMIRVRAEFLGAIGKSFKYFSDQIKYNNLLKFKEDCVKPFQDAISHNDSYESFCVRLERVDLYFLYNRKLKEITVDRALELFRDQNGDVFNFDNIRRAFSDYEKSFKEMFNDIIDKRKSISDIVNQTRESAEKLQFKRSNIPHIIAGLSVVLSLTVSDFIEKNFEKKYVLKSECSENYLLQPHCIQILGVLILLGIDENSNSIPAKHIAEILTGQGKSWALGLIAGYFSLIGYQVTVACYSDYLTQRDSAEFKKNFDPYNFLHSVEYHTFESMCERILTSNEHNKTLEQLVFDILSGNPLTTDNIQHAERTKSILLIDEVDVFFSENFGFSHNPLVLVHTSWLREIQEDIWKTIMSGNSDRHRLETVANERLYRSISQHNIISILNRSTMLKQHLDRMIDTALRVYEDMKTKNELRGKYEIKNDKICSRNFDGTFVSNFNHGYENSFYYLKLIYERHQSFVQGALKEANYGYFVVQCGSISYSELPNSYDGIFGVSGTVKALSNEEKSLLKHYRINKTSYYPSFFGGSKLKFSKENDFVITQSKKDWLNTIVDHTRKQINCERSVLIYFNDEELLIDFYRLCSGDLAVIPFYITQNKVFDGKEEPIYYSETVNKLIKEYAGHHGKVTLLTRQCGRGVDFQAEPKVNEKGGMHVIQTFFSVDIKEEIQIKGRTARKDDPGSYELVLCLEHLLVPNVERMSAWQYENITTSTTYDELNTQRNLIVDSFCSYALQRIQLHRELHEKTVSFFQRAMTECSDINRLQFIEELKELQ